MPRVAFHTFGLLRADWDDPLVEGFVERIPGAFEAAEGSAGFIARARRQSGVGDPTTDWGPICYPAAVPTELRPRVAATCTLWKDLESVYAYAYGGAHGEAMKRRRDWIVEWELPTSVAWWVGDQHIPNFGEACEKLEHLHEHGSTPFAFSLRQPFGPDGASTAIDQQVVKARLSHNARLPVNLRRTAATR